MSIYNLFSENTELTIKDLITTGGLLFSGLPDSREGPAWPKIFVIQWKQFRKSLCLEHLTNAWKWVSYYKS